MKNIEGLIWNGQAITPETTLDDGLVVATERFIYLLSGNKIHAYMSGQVNCLLGSQENKPEIYLGMGNKIFRIKPKKTPEEFTFLEQIGIRDGNVTSLCSIKDILFDAGRYSHVLSTNLLAKNPSQTTARVQQVCPGATKLARYGDQLMGLVPEQALEFTISISYAEYEAQACQRIIDFGIHDDKIYLAKLSPGPVPGQPLNQPTEISITEADKSDILAKRIGKKAILQSAGENKKILFDAVGNKIYNTLEDPEGKKPLWTLESNITCMTTLPLASWWAFYEAVNK